MLDSVVSDPTPATGHPDDRPFRRFRESWDDLLIKDWSSRSWLRARVAALVCVLFLVAAFHDAWRKGWPIPERVLVMAALAVFAVCFGRVIWRNTPGMNGNRAPWSIVVAVAIGIPLVPLLGTAWLASFSTYVVAMLLFHCAGRFWAPIVFGAPAAPLLLGWAAVAGHRVPWVTGAQTLLIGAFIAAF